MENKNEPIPVHTEAFKEESPKAVEHVKSVAFIITPKGENGCNIDLKFDPPNQDDLKDGVINNDPCLKLASMIMNMLKGEGAEAVE